MCYRHWIRSFLLNAHFPNGDGIVHGSASIMQKIALFCRHHFLGRVQRNKIINPCTSTAPWNVMDCAKTRGPNRSWFSTVYFLGRYTSYPVGSVSGNAGFTTGPVGEFFVLPPVVKLVFRPRIGPYRNIHFFSLSGSFQDERQI